MIQETLYFIGKLTKKYQRKYIIGLTLTILCAITSFVTPMVSQYLIDNIVSDTLITNAIKKILFFGIILIANPIISFFRDTIFNSINVEVKYDLQQLTFNQLFNVPYSFFEKNAKGEILSKLTNDVNQIGDFVSDFFTLFILNTTMVVGILIGMFYYSFPITISILIIMILSIIFSNKFNSKISKQSKLSQEGFDNNCIIITNTIYNILIVKVFNCENFLKNKYQTSTESYKKDTLKLYNYRSTTQILVEISSVVCLAIVFVVGFILVYYGKMTIGYVIALSVYFQMLGNPLVSLMDAKFKFHKIKPILDRVKSFLETDESNETKTVSLYNLDESESIVFENVYYSYPNEKIVLEKITFSISPNSITAISGNSGSGKSTLASLILGIRYPQKGNIYFGKIPIDKINISNYILPVPQNTELFNISILDNILLGDKSLSIEYVYDLARKVDIHDHILSLKDGYNTIVSDELNLSGGQAQRICIIRALVRKPKLIIFDEPTSALDSINTNKLIDLFVEIKINTTIIVITHNDDIIKSSDFVIEINKKTAFTYSSINEYLNRIKGEN